MRSSLPEVWRKNVKYISIILFILFLNFPVWAGVGVVQSLVEISTSAGSNLTGYFTVVNNFKQETEVTVHLENIARYGERIEIKEWLNVIPEEFLLKPGEVKEIKYEIKVATGIRGALTGRVFFASINPEPGSLRIGTRIGIPVYVIIEGTENLDGEIEKITIRKDSEKGKEGIRFMIVVKNEGNVHFRPRGKVVVRDKKREKIGETEVIYGWPVFPGRKHNYRAFWEIEDLDKGKYQAEIIFSYGDLYSKLNKSFKKIVNFKLTKEKIQIINQNE